MFPLTGGTLVAAYHLSVTIISTYTTRSLRRSYCRASKPVGRTKGHNFCATTCPGVVSVPTGADAYSAAVLQWTPLDCWERRCSGNGRHTLNLIFTNHCSDDKEIRVIGFHYTKILQLLWIFVIRILPSVWRFWSSLPD